MVAEELQRMPTFPYLESALAFWFACPFLHLKKTCRCKTMAALQTISQVLYKELKNMVWVRLCTSYMLPRQYYIKLLGR